MPADYALLRDVLTRELARSGDGVRGGAVVEDDSLDDLLRRQARDEHPASALLRMIAALPPEGYATLEGTDRETWLRRALATVRRELALEESLEPVRPDAPGGRLNSGRGPSAKAKKPKSPPPPETRPAESQPTRRSGASKIAEGAAGLDAPIEVAGTGLRGAALQRLQV